MDSQLFKDHLRENEFRENGYTILQLNDMSILDAIENIYKSKILPKLDTQTEFYYSLGNDLSFNTDLKDKLAKILKPAYDQWFINYDHLAESFLIKRAHDKEELALHQDWNFVDESKHISVTLWCPFLHINSNNGGFFLIKKSHALFKNIRSDSYQTSRIPSSDKMKDIITEISLIKGQVLAFHPAVFHGSHPNQTATERPVASTLIKSKNTPLLHYVKKGDSLATVYEIEEETLMSELVNLSNSVPPSSYVSKKDIPYQHEAIDFQKLIDCYEG